MSTGDDESEHIFDYDTDEGIMDEIMEYAMDDAEEDAIAKQLLAAEMVVMREDMSARIRNVRKHSPSSDVASSSHQSDCYIFNKPGTGSGDNDNDRFERRRLKYRRDIR